MTEKELQQQSLKAQQTALQRLQEANVCYAERNDIDNIICNIQEIFMIPGISFDGAEQQVLQYFDEVELLRDYVDDCEQIFYGYRYEMIPNSTNDAINQITDHYTQGVAALQQAADEIINLILKIPHMTEEDDEPPVVDD